MQDIRFYSTASYRFFPQFFVVVVWLIASLTLQLAVIVDTSTVFEFAMYHRSACTHPSDKLKFVHFQVQCKTLNIKWSWYNIIKQVIYALNYDCGLAMAKEQKAKNKYIKKNTHSYIVYTIQKTDEPKRT